VKQKALREVVYSRIMADEQEIASDVCAGSEPEIERAESSEAEPVKEPDESAAAEGDIGEAGCPIVKREIGGSRCGRKLHVALEGADEYSVCLMHSKDPRKQSGPLFDAFWLEFERILAEAGENEAHFERFVFPQLNFRERKFKASCRFSFATFMQNTDFNNATFTQNAYFDRVTFSHYADFSRATFTQNAEFGSATFAGGAEFYEATFSQEAYFVGATFTHDASFAHAVFEQLASFTQATFTQEANFNGAMFRQNAHLLLTVFRQEAHFIDTTFRMSADFPLATFTQATRFANTHFLGMANWKRSRFLDQAEFRCTKFEPQVEGEPSAVFALAKFSKPSEIVFDDVDLSRALFHDCDVSEVWFSSSVGWAKREGDRGLKVFEETIDLKQEFAEGLQRDGQRDYRAVAQIYQQLKKNYDSRLDYWTANEFHFGEMEMKRLAGPTDGPFLWLRQWWHPRLSLVALYRYASDYGNSYGKPMLWLLGTLVLFAALLPLPGVGLKRQGATQAETYASVWRAGDSVGPNLWAEARLAGKGAITSVDAATFQKSAEYAPAYPWGRVLAIFETLLTSSLFALFLLAIRRQFRR
jgi:hypothetical protein